MSVIAIGLNLLLAGLLAAALMMGYRLNIRLKALRDSHEGFAKAVAELDAAAARAEQGLADLRAATDEATDALADRIEKARALTAKLDRQTQDHGRSAPAAAVTAATAALTRVRALREDMEPVTARARPMRRDLDLDLDLDVDAKRVAHRLGSLLSGSREPRPRPEPERVVRREPPMARQRPRFEEDLFDLDAADEGRPMLRAVGGR
jgi:uncharacterized membrane protein